MATIKAVDSTAKAIAVAQGAPFGGLAAAGLANSEKDSRAQFAGVDHGEQPGEVVEVKLRARP